jgi:hypothetical protein
MISQNGISRSKKSGRPMRHGIMIAFDPRQIIAGSAN